MKKFIIIMVLGSFTYSYSAENSHSAQNSNIPLPSEAIMLKKKHDKKLDKIKQEFSPSFLNDENLKVHDGRLSPRNSPSHSGNVTPTGSSGKLLNSHANK